MRAQNIVIIGFRGTGKTTFGREMAKQLGLPFADLDEQIEFVLGETIDSFVDKHGWQVFRELEQRVTHDFSRNFSGIVATGGGTIENSKNLQNLSKTGKFLHLNPKFLQVRKFLMKDTTRPRLNPDIPLMQEIDEMWNQRKDMYRASADFDVIPDLNGDPVEEAKKLIAAIPETTLPLPPKPKTAVILSSSNGTTFQGILDAQKEGRIPNSEIALFVTDKPECGALTKAEDAGIDTEVLEKDDLTDEEYDRELINIVREVKPDYIFLAGFMKILSPVYCSAFGNITINAHPSLLPKFAGLIGDAVHEKVLDFEEKYSGASFHRVTPKLDGGEMVLQRKVLVDDFETLESLRLKVQKQEILGFCELLERK